MSVTPLIQHHTGVLDNMIRQEKRYMWFIDQKEKSLFRYDKFQNGKRSTALLIKRRKIKKWGDVLNGRSKDYLSFIR